MKLKCVNYICAIFAVLLLPQQATATKKRKHTIITNNNDSRLLPLAPKKKNGLYVPMKTVNKPKRCFKWLDYSKLYAEDADDYYAPEKWEECRRWFESVVPSKSPAPSRSPAPSKPPTSKPSALPSSLQSSTPTAHPSYIPSETPSSIPSLSHSINPSPSPTSTPTVSHSNVPTSMPVYAPSSSPTNVTSNRPSPSPLVSSRPSSVEKVVISLPLFRLSLTFEANSNDQRMLSSLRQKSSQNLVDEQKLFQAIFNILSYYYTQEVKDFYALNLSLTYEKTSPQARAQTTQTTVSFTFSGYIILKQVVHDRMDATEIPSESDLQRYTLMSFSSVKEQIPSKISGATHSTFKSWVVSTVKPAMNAQELEDAVVVDESSARSETAIPIAVVSSIVAIVSTLTAFFLIYKQSHNNGNDVGIETPSKQTNGQEETISKARKFRSPFLNVTPSGLPEGTRKYFSRLDDDSLYSKAYSSILNPKQSIVDSSFEDSSYNGSLQAPSLSSSKTVGQSLDTESLAGMSALDNVRLNSVLQFDEDTQEDKSISSNDTGIFRKIWYGRSSASKEGSIRKLTPPKNDTPTKKSPSKPKPKPTKNDSVTIVKKEDVDDSSLLGDQSSKSEYYGQNEDSNHLYYNMLGQRSVASESSEDIDFNQMYKGDGVASSSGYSDNASDLEIMSRGSRFSSV